MENAKEIAESTAKAAMEKLKEMNMVENAKGIVESTAKAAMEKLKEMNMVENAKGIADSTGKAAMEKLKEMNMVENVKEIINKTMPFVFNFVKISFDLLLKTAKEIVVKPTPSVRTSSNWLLEKAPPLISTAANQIQKAPLYYTIPIGFLLILLLRRCCCCGGGGGTGKTMKAPGKKNVRMSRRDFESSPKSYFRDLRSKNE